MENSPKLEHMIYQFVDDPSEADATAWVFPDKDTLKQAYFKFPELGDDEIRANVTYSGLCLSDVHHARGIWGPVVWPCVPGHEVLAEVSEVGKEVTDFKKGDRVGFMPIRKTCGSCVTCKTPRDQLCNQEDDKFLYGMYFGGYATAIQQPAQWAFKLPEKFDVKRGAPLLCAGVTVYDPIVEHTKEGDKVGVIGIGGLGHLAVMFLKALGRVPVAITRGKEKYEQIKKLGADIIIDSTDEKDCKQYFDSLNAVINTIPSNILTELAADLLLPSGTIIQVGVGHFSEKLSITTFKLIAKELNWKGSLVANQKNTKAMLEFCAENEIYPTLEEFSFEEFEKAFDRLEHGKPIFRCSVDVQTYAEKNGWKK